jgi:hypothetical protein
MVAGSFASNYHGVPRMTQDADIVVDARGPAILAGSLAGKPAVFATAEDTILTKLEWAKLGQSERQYQDALQLAQMQATRLEWTYIEHWAESLGISELVARLRRGAPFTGS